MKNIITFLIKHKFHAATSLLFIVWIGSCSKNSEIRKLEKTTIEHTYVSDSLNNQVNSLTQKIDSFPEFLRSKELSIHIEYDNYISRQDRGKQLMDLHMIVKDNIRNVRNK